MKTSSKNHLILLSVVLAVFLMLNACSQNLSDRNTQENQSQIDSTTNPQLQVTLAQSKRESTTDPKVINAGTLSRLVSSKQLNHSSAMSFIWLSEGQGILVATESDLGLFRVLSGKTFAPITQLKATMPRLLTISRTTSMVAWTSTDNLIHFWNIDKQLTDLPALGTGDAVITGLSISPTSSTLAQSATDHSVTIWDIDLRQQAITWMASAWLTELSFSPDGKQIAGVDPGNFSLDIFNIESGAKIRQIKWRESSSPVLYNARFSPDWQRVAWVSRGIVQIMDVSNEHYGPLLMHEDYVNEIAWSPDGRIIATASAATVDENFVPVVQFWDALNGKLVKTIPQPASILELDFSPDGYELAILLSSGVLEIYTVQ